MSIKRTSFFSVQGWMITDLELKGNELLIYAVIHGFSQLDGQTFKGSINYLCDWTNASPKTVSNCIASLKAKGLLKVIEHSGSANEYIAITDKIDNDDKEQGEPPAPKPESKPEKKVETKPEAKREKSEKNTAKGIPTVEQVKAYVKEEKFDVDAEAFCNYYTACGWKIGGRTVVDWKALVRSWKNKNNTYKSNSNPYKYVEEDFDCSKYDEFINKFGKNPTFPDNPLKENTPTKSNAHNTLDDFLAKQRSEWGW